ncbi:Outer membrane chaperone Skp (OmpH) [Sterolibacterium denitrificans]|uniref:Outer membrane chaperone Skp (OmpH) n=1 Tax=Sterolibacterium denitrificans TaxID=157592 RepID=A0A7Z7HRF8_9PROT|nr:OmpH family outer membrane protein [Sterolibacterium denitrificans]SMB25718.1 Outer membrane chaperone Skp (OmpH) [Sterolibacterium denitrificans]
MNKIITSLLFMAMLLGAGAAHAQLKIGYVNTQRILVDAPQAAKAKQKIEREFERRSQDLQRLAKQLQSLQEAVEKNAVTMSEAQRRNKEREFGELSREFQRRQREYREDLNLRQNEEMAAIFDRLSKAINFIAESEKFDLILQEAVYASPRIDITDRVIKALGDAPVPPAGK